MVVKVNASCTKRVRMNQVVMTVALVEVGDGANKSMSVITQKVKTVTDKVNGITGVVCELQSAGVRPHMVWKQDASDKSNKRTERVRDGDEAYALLTIKVPFGTAKLNPIAKVIADADGSLTVRYSLSDTIRDLEEGVIRFKLMTEAMRQCRDLISSPDGKPCQGVTITPSRVYYHSQDEGSAACGAYKMADRAGMGVEVADNEVSFDLDSIYTAEHAPHTAISDSLEVAFDVEGYVPPVL